MKALVALTITLISIITVCPQQKRFDFQSVIGVVERQTNGSLCMAIPNSALAKDEKVNVVYTGKPQVVINAVVVEKLSESCSRTYSTADIYTFYSLKIDKKDAQKIEAQPLGIAIAGLSKSVLVSKGRASVDIDGDGGKEYFRECATNEGVTFTIWKGIPLKGKRVWHQSYYLGYDVEPTCTKKDYEGIE